MGDFQTFALSTIGSVLHSFTPSGIMRMTHPSNSLVLWKYPNPNLEGLRYKSALWPMCFCLIVSLPPGILIFPKSNRSNSSTLVIRSHGICAISGSCPAITQRPPTFCRVPLELVALQAEESSPSIISGESSLLPWNSQDFLPILDSGPIISCLRTMLMVYIYL